MKLPRDVAADALVRALLRVGYTVSRQTGSHVRLTLAEPPQHHVTVPAHSPLAAILAEVAQRLGCDRVALLQRLNL